MSLLLSNISNNNKNNLQEILSEFQIIKTCSKYNNNNKNNNNNNSDTIVVFVTD